MNQFTRRIASLALAVTMAVTMMPTPAFAAEAGFFSSIMNAIKSIGAEDGTVTLSAEQLKEVTGNKKNLELYQLAVKDAFTIDELSAANVEIVSLSQEFRRGLFDQVFGQQITQDHKTQPVRLGVAKPELLEALSWEFQKGEGQPDPKSAIEKSVQDLVKGYMAACPNQLYWMDLNKTATIDYTYKTEQAEGSKDIETCTITKLQVTLPIAKMDDSLYKAYPQTIKTAVTRAQSIANNNSGTVSGVLTAYKDFLCGRAQPIVSGSESQQLVGKTVWEQLLDIFAEATMNDGVKADSLAYAHAFQYLCNHAPEPRNFETSIVGADASGDKFAGKDFNVKVSGDQSIDATHAWNVVKDGSEGAKFYLADIALTDKLAKNGELFLKSPAQQTGGTSYTYHIPETGDPSLTVVYNGLDLKELTPRPPKIATVAITGGDQSIDIPKVAKIGTDPEPVTLNLSTEVTFENDDPDKRPMLKYQWELGKLPKGVTVKFDKNQEFSADAASNTITVTNKVADPANKNLKFTVKVTAQHAWGVDDVAEAVSKEITITLNKEEPKLTFSGIYLTDADIGGNNRVIISEHKIQTPSKLSGSSKKVSYSVLPFDQYGFEMNAVTAKIKEWNWKKIDQVGELPQTSNIGLLTTSDAHTVAATKTATVDVKKSSQDGYLELQAIPVMQDTSLGDNSKAASVVIEIYTHTIKELAISLTDPLTYGDIYDPDVYFDGNALNVSESLKSKTLRFEYYEGTAEENREKEKSGQAVALPEGAIPIGKDNRAEKVGTYAVKAYYTLEDEKGTCWADLSIVPRSLNDSRISIKYLKDNPLNFEYDGKEKTIQFELMFDGNRISPEQNFDVSYRNNRDASIDEPAQLVISGKGLFKDDLVIDFTIHAKKVTAERVNKDMKITKVYDGDTRVTTEGSGGVAFKVPDASGVGDIRFNVLLEYQNKNVGKQIPIQEPQIPESFKDTLKNYDISYPDLVGDITRRQVTITGASASKKYGQKDPELTYEVSTSTASTGLVAGEKLEGRLDREPGEDVRGDDEGGGYQINNADKIINNLSNQNYNISFIPGGMLVIEPAQIELDMSFAPSNPKADRDLKITVTARNKETLDEMPAGCLAPAELAVTGPYGPIGGLEPVAGRDGVYTTSMHTHDEDVPKEGKKLDFALSVVPNEATARNYIMPEPLAKSITMIKAGKVTLQLEQEAKENLAYGDSVTYTATITKMDPADTDKIDGWVDFYLVDPDKGITDPTKEKLDKEGKKLGTVNVIEDKAEFILLNPALMTAGNHEIHAIYSGCKAFEDGATSFVRTHVGRRELQWDVSDLSASRPQDSMREAPVYGELRIKGVLNHEVGLKPVPMETRGFNQVDVGVQENVTIVPKMGTDWELVSPNIGRDFKDNYKLPDDYPKIAAVVTAVADTDQPDLLKKKLKITVEEGLSTVPEAFIGNYDLDLESPAKIKAKLIAPMLKKGVKEKDTKLYDVSLLASDDGGPHWRWRPANENDYPTPDGKMKVKLPYPKGTSGESHDFMVTHMATTELFKMTPGSIEVCPVKELKDGIEFTVTGFSPVSVGWKQPGAEGEEAKPEGEKTEGDADKEDSQQDGEKKDDASKAEGNKPSAGAQAGAEKTGDESHINGWIAGMLICGIAAAALFLFGFRKK